jgi:subtilisin family serine protease
MARRVILEVRADPLEFGLEQARRSPRETAAQSSHLKRLSSFLDIDESFPVFMVPLAPNDHPRIEDRAMRALPRHNHAIRGEVDENTFDELIAMTNDPDDDLDGVYVDLPMLESQGFCPTAPVGGLADVERLLATSRLRSLNMNGNRVLVALIDSGVSAKYLHGAGRTNSIFPGFGYPSGVNPDTMPVSHGTMTAFDVSIAAPQATLWDFPIITRVDSDEVLRKYTSDGAQAYRFMVNAIQNHGLLSSFKGLVVNNSWCIYDLSFDMPAGHPANYSSNPNHTFNRAVSELAAAGADIVFAAGNCGPDCPVTACTQSGATIYGANSHPEVLCVGAVSTSGHVLGYSATGPGFLSRVKPDLCAFSHFVGSQVGGEADTGTSTAAPVAAGMIAAIRSRIPINTADPNTGPAAVRAFLQKKADRFGSPGWPRPDMGWGILDGAAIAAVFEASTGAGL